MKLLFILFFANLLLNSSSADVDVKIKNEFNKKYAAKFKTQPEADEWINDNISNDSWGKKERWVKSSEVSDLSKCLERKDIIPELGEQYEMCKLPKEYSILICDTDQTYGESDDCFLGVKEYNDKKAKEAADKQRIDELKLKDKDNIKLDELYELLKLKGVL